MSPFAKRLRAFRLARQLQQKNAAELLGYEQSHLSALETGIKGPPKKEFIEKLIAVYRLTEEERLQIFEDLNRSKRRFILGRNATEDEYEIWLSLEQMTGKLQPAQIALIKLVLNLNQ